MMQSTFHLLYDSRCPLCVAELKKLKQRDKANQLQLIDIHDSSWQEQYSHLSFDDVSQRLHGFYYDKDNDKREWFYGLDATYHSWKAVGLGFVIAPLRWPLIRNVADMGYRFFARHRGKIARLLTGKEECTQCGVNEMCGLPQTKQNEQR